jgi:hypothetical protein
VKVPVRPRAPEIGQAGTNGGRAPARGSVVPDRSAARSSRCWPSSCLVSSGPVGHTVSCPSPARVPRFFEYLAAERGLRPESIVSYQAAVAVDVGIGRRCLRPRGFANRV